MAATPEKVLATANVSESTVVRPVCPPWAYGSEPVHTVPVSDIATNGCEHLLLVSANDRSMAIKEIPS